MEEKEEGEEEKEEEMMQFDWITFDRIETDLFLPFFSAQYPFDRRSIIRNLIYH